MHGMTCVAWTYHVLSKLHWNKIHTKRSRRDAHASFTIFLFITFIITMQDLHNHFNQPRNKGYVAWPEDLPRCSRRRSTPRRWPRLPCPLTARPPAPPNSSFHAPYARYYYRLLLLRVYCPLHVGVTEVVFISFCWWLLFLLFPSPSFLWSDHDGMKIAMLMESSCK